MCVSTFYLNQWLWNFPSPEITWPSDWQVLVDQDFYCFIRLIHRQYVPNFHQNLPQDDVHQSWQHCLSHRAEVDTPFPSYLVVSTSVRILPPLHPGSPLLLFSTSSHLRTHYHLPPSLSIQRVKSDACLAVCVHKTRWLNFQHSWEEKASKYSHKVMHEVMHLFICKGVKTLCSNHFACKFPEIPIQQTCFSPCASELCPSSHIPVQVDKEW